MNETLRGNYGVLVGIGCGRVIHSAEVPLDTAIYLDAADQIRERESCTRGALILADVEVSTEIVEYREERLKKVLEILGVNSHWDLIKQSTIPREEADEVNLSNNIPKEDKDYFKREVQDSIILLRPMGVKVGWVLDDVRRTGGEAHFDVEIARNRSDIRFIYDLGSPEVRNIRKRKKSKDTNVPSLVGIPLQETYGKRKPPYLVKKPEQHLRVCLPKDLSQLEQEMEKTSRNTPGNVAQKRIIEFCKLISERVEKNGRTIDENLESVLTQFIR